MKQINEPYDGPVLDVAQVVELEKIVSDKGTSLFELMKRAGNAVSDAAQSMLWENGKTIIVLVGSGNNGGDGWVAASNLAKTGYDVTLVTKQSACEIVAEPARSAAIEVSEEDDFAIFIEPD